MTDKLYFEDIAKGDRFAGATVTVEREEMLDFGRRFDDQPMHFDVEAAKAMGFRDVVACGAYTFALSSKATTHIWQQWHFLPSGLGVQLDFLAPLFAGDVLTTELEVLGTRPSSKPVRGWLETILRCTNQSGETAFTTRAHFLLQGRPGGKGE
ncbi:MaoC family dehydratase N-terminal domain-containing protein [Sneathiella sp. CAU 1612]|uniref:MaoC family dehydratase N-terminal domain-containing protein n=1 Tax=Sneathiella sedimenti TaxID=2816034 RepID=A0ABS3F541_9PROT|nr:MaoC/PaaZ C-terminal domain-containing protein [Sneathiella sedimenti]MBO0333580.1 MaoC family dehydratase N-terminal domain-containing protein [Sneathiella sedimenti]